MKSFCLKLILVLIAIMAFNYEYVKSDQNQNVRIITVSPTLDIDPLKNPSSRGFEKLLNYIADPFIAIVVLVHSLYEEPNFEFYLPVYLLHRLSFFFLLI